MTLREILEHRRAVRRYDPNKPLDTERVEDCLRQATLAPTSSNMQLWECYHVTQPDTMGRKRPMHCTKALFSNPLMPKKRLYCKGISRL